MIEFLIILVVFGLLFVPSTMIVISFEYTRKGKIIAAAVGLVFWLFISFGMWSKTVSNQESGMATSVNGVVHWELRNAAKNRMGILFLSQVL